MGHVSTGSRSVPMDLASWDERDISGRHLMFFIACGDDAVTVGDDQDLIGGVLVEAVARAVAEVDLQQVEVLAIRVRRLRADVADEDRRGRAGGRRVAALV